MTAPNIEMIAASLRGCSLGRGGGTVAAHPLEGSDESGGEVITVELNSETALPHQWEQCLDLRTGEVYYFNWETGTRTTKDPRTAAAASPAVTFSSGYKSGKDDDVDSSSDDSCSTVGGSDDGRESSVDTANSSSSCVSSVSSSSPPPEAVAEPGGGQVLVAAGCRSCFMYFMVPKSADACPKCGSGLLHLGRNGCV